MKKASLTCLASLFSLEILCCKCVWYNCDVTAMHLYLVVECQLQVNQYESLLLAKTKMVQLSYLGKLSYEVLTTSFQIDVFHE